MFFFYHKERDVDTYYYLVVSLVWVDIGHESASMIFDDYFIFKTLLIENLVFFEIDILHFKEQHILINKTKTSKSRTWRDKS